MSASVSLNLETGYASFQNLGLLAFNLAEEPIKCSPLPDQINCAKEHSGNSMSASSSLTINRYTGLMTEAQRLISTGAYVTTMHVRGEYKCKTVEKPLF
jgi:hypothetical protein